MDPLTAGVVGLCALTVGAGAIVGAVAGAYVMGRSHGRAEVGLEEARADLAALREREERFDEAREKAAVGRARVDALPDDALDELLSAGEAGGGRGEAP